MTKNFSLSFRESHFFSEVNIFYSFLLSAHSTFLAVHKEFLMNDSRKVFVVPSKLRQEFRVARFFLGQYTKTWKKYTK
jgi:hypothetical protein